MSIETTNQSLTADALVDSPAARMLEKLGPLKAALQVIGAKFFDRTLLIGDGASEHLLRGVTRMEDVYEGAAHQPVVVVYGSDLKPGRSYFIDGHIALLGDAPRDITLNAAGRVRIFGDVGPGAVICAELAEKHPDMTYRKPVNKESGPQGPLDSLDASEGLRYPNDKRPAITVTGYVGSEAHLMSNAGIRVGSAAPDAKIVADNWRLVEIEDRQKARSTPKPPMNRGPG